MRPRTSLLFALLAASLLACGSPEPAPSAAPRAEPPRAEPRAEASSTQGPEDESDSTTEPETEEDSELRPGLPGSALLITDPEVLAALEERGEGLAARLGPRPETRPGSRPEAQAEGSLAELVRSSPLYAELVRRIEADRRAAAAEAEQDSTEDAP